MCCRLFYVSSEALIIFLAAILGTFAFNHASDIFNRYVHWGECCITNIKYLWEGTLNDIHSYPAAYLAILVVFVVLLAVLWCRAKWGYSAAPKARVK